MIQAAGGSSSPLTGSAKLRAYSRQAFTEVLNLGFEFIELGHALPSYFRI